MTLTPLDTALLGLRPHLPQATTEAAGPAEAFQNATLRPVLKLQHDRLVDAWRRYVDKHKGAFDKLRGPARVAYLHHALHTNRELRAFLTGLVGGVLTKVEWEAFRQNEAELTRRLIDLVEQRLVQHDTALAPG